MLKLTIAFSKLSDVGLVRTSNEDFAEVIEITPLASRKGKATIVAAVADGMGGHAAGEVASRIAVETFLRVANRYLMIPMTLNFADIIEQAFKEANETIYDLGENNPEMHGMGTTLTTALILGTSLFVGHIGDSRAYLIRDQYTRQITRDHSVIQQKLAAGLLSPEEAQYSTDRNQLLRVVGTNSTVICDIVCEELKNGDVLVLCSDGLHNSLSDEVLTQIIASSSNPQEACHQLIEYAKAADGSDNITAVCIGIGDAFRAREFLPGKQPRGMNFNNALWISLIIVVGLISSLVTFMFARQARQPVLNGAKSGSTVIPGKSPAVTSKPVQSQNNKSLSNSSVSTPVQKPNETVIPTIPEPTPPTKTKKFNSPW